MKESFSLGQPVNNNLRHQPDLLRLVKTIYSGVEPLGYYGPKT